MANKNNTNVIHLVDPTTGKQWQPGGATGYDEKGNLTYPIKPPSKPKPATAPGFNKPQPKPTPSRPGVKPQPKPKPMKPLGRSSGGITGPGGKQVNPVYNTY